MSFETVDSFVSFCVAVDADLYCRNVMVPFAYALVVDFGSY